MSQMQLFAIAGKQASRRRAMRPCHVICKECRMTYTVETWGSWWLYFSKCFGCGAYPRINDDPLPWPEDEFLEWLTQDGQRKPGEPWKD